MTVWASSRKWTILPNLVPARAKESTEFITIENISAIIQKILENMFTCFEKTKTGTCQSKTRYSFILFLLSIGTSSIAKAKGNDKKILKPYIYLCFCPYFWQEAIELGNPENSCLLNSCSRWLTHQSCVLEWKASTKIFSFSMHTR